MSYSRAKQNFHCGYTNGCPVCGGKTQKRFGNKRRRRRETKIWKKEEN